MKKFLSLVLALVMTMSLVTISAGATEYKDLTDKDEIQYEEAVAVLNRIGVITGYEDGSFRPETELTRGAAAKIIVSLLIGPEAASNLPNTYAPYPDVPANHTFAGVISYCKTAGIISGYGDGTFKPANSLTGYAFAKMLLGAIGYDSKIQGYTDTGWTMNVARDGNKAGQAVGGGPGGETAPAFAGTASRGNGAAARRRARDIKLHIYNKTKQIEISVKQQIWNKDIDFLNFGEISKELLRFHRQDELLLLCYNYL